MLAAPVVYAAGSAAVVAVAFVGGWISTWKIWGRLLKDQQQPEAKNGTFLLDDGTLVRIKTAFIR